MVTINFNIQKKDLYLISAIVVFIVGTGIVIATGGTPAINGHSYGELGIPTNCGNNQVLKWNTATSAWSCGDDNTGGVTYRYYELTGSGGNTNRMYYAPNKNCFAFARHLADVEKGNFLCNYDSASGNFEAYAWNNIVYCGYVCLD